MLGAYGSDDEETDSQHTGSQHTGGAASSAAMAARGSSEGAACAQPGATEGEPTIQLPADRPETAASNAYVAGQRVHINDLPTDLLERILLAVFTPTRGLNPKAFPPNKGPYITNANWMVHDARLTNVCRLWRDVLHEGQKVILQEQEITVDDLDLLSDTYTRTLLLHTPQPTFLGRYVTQPILHLNVSRDEFGHFHDVHLEVLNGCPPDLKRLITKVVAISTPDDRWTEETWTPVREQLPGIPCSHTFHVTRPAEPMPSVDAIQNRVGDALLPIDTLACFLSDITYQQWREQTDRLFAGQEPARLAAGLPPRESPATFLARFTITPTVTLDRSEFWAQQLAESRPQDIVELNFSTEEGRLRVSPEDLAPYTGTVRVGGVRTTSPDLEGWACKELLLRNIQTVGTIANCPALQDFTCTGLLNLWSIHSLACLSSLRLDDCPLITSLDGIAQGLHCLNRLVLVKANVDSVANFPALVGLGIFQPRGHVQAFTPRAHKTFVYAADSILGLRFCVEVCPQFEHLNDLDVQLVDERAPLDHPEWYEGDLHGIAIHLTNCPNLAHVGFTHAHILEAQWPEDGVVDVAITEGGAAAVATHPAAAGDEAGPAV